MSQLTISDEVREKIVREHVEPHYLKEVELLFKGKRDWKLIGQIFETTSKALVAIGGIISFAAGFFDEYYLSFIAGAISTISLATLQFSSFGYKEMKKQGHELNVNLKKLQIEEVPVEDRSADDQTIMARQSMRSSSMRNNENEIRNMSMAYQAEIAAMHAEMERRTLMTREEISIMHAEMEKMAQINKELTERIEKENSEKLQKEIVNNNEEESEDKENIKEKVLYKSDPVEFIRNENGKLSLKIHKSDGVVNIPIPSKQSESSDEEFIEQKV